MESESQNNKHATPTAVSRPLSPLPKYWSASKDLNEDLKDMQNESEPDDEKMKQEEGETCARVF